MTDSITPEVAEDVAQDASKDVPLKDTEQSAALSPNLELWVGYEEAFHYFNKHLFDNKLPPCILTFNAKGRSWGYFKTAIWGNQGDTLHEICLNPELLKREDDMIFQMLVRCMVHLWEHNEGMASKLTRYCSVNFTEKMAELGLPCSDSCGMNVSHSVDANGQYAAIRPAVLRFFPLKNQVQFEQPRKTRIRYTCPECGFQAMAAAGGKLFCHTENCDTEMVKESEQEQDC